MSLPCRRTGLDGSYRQRKTPMRISMPSRSNLNNPYQLFFLITLLASFCSLTQCTSVALYPKRGGASSALLASAKTSVTLDCIKTGVAGGIAGAVGTFTLYPLDAAKTVRQASPQQHASVRAALRYLIRNRSVYRGLWTAVVGAIPSSALYFGAYETAKRVLQHYSMSKGEISTSLPRRLAFHSAAAASGNLVSSAVFVPKELIKQQLQFLGASSRTWTSLLFQIVREKGVTGLYVGYKATVLRNIPSAAIRFALYEELKRALTLGDSGDMTLNWKLFAAGAIAGAMASGLMTPVDVLKSRITTGTCPVDVRGCAVHVLSTDGWSALWAGAGSRMISSAAFSSIGFGTFEAVKRLLCVSSTG